MNASAVFYVVGQPKSPPVYNYLWKLLLGKFDMKNNGPVKFIESGYKEKGDIFTINLMHRRVTFFIGPDAISNFFTQPDTVLSQREVYGFTIPVFGKNIVYDSPGKDM
jgi:sterol 14-demethylase